MDFMLFSSKPLYVVLSGVVLGAGLVAAEVAFDGNLNISQVIAASECVDAVTILDDAF